MTTPTFYYAQRGGFRFSRREIKELGISILVLTLAFAILFSGGINGVLIAVADLTFVFYFMVSLLAVVTAFFFHEMAHKFLAQRYGCWAEFNYSILGLMFALFTSLVGIIFAAPGAVIIGGPITKEENGRISAAGPATNLTVGAAFAGAYFVTRSLDVSLLAGGFGLEGVFYIVAWINVVLGGFNLIPFPPLDGSKIYNWNPAVYITLVLMAVLLFVVLTIL